MLILPIKKKWFDMIVSGEKKEEYREIKPYYDSRFMNAFGFLLVGGQMAYGEAVTEEGFAGSRLQMHPAFWKR